MVAKGAEAVRGALPRKASAACPRAMSAWGRTPEATSARAQAPEAGTSAWGRVRAPGATSAWGRVRARALASCKLGRRAPAGTGAGTTAAGIQSHPPPTVLFTITGNTVLSQSLLSTATSFRVAIWVQVVFEDATIPNDPNPDLYIGPLTPMNQSVYGAAMPLPSQTSLAHSKLTSPTTPPMAVPGDPDPPEVD
jgi:hypothetical protein